MQSIWDRSRRMAVASGVVLGVLAVGIVAFAVTNIYGGDNVIHDYGGESPAASVGQESNFGAIAVGGICTVDSTGTVSDPVTQLCNYNIAKLASATTTIDTLLPTIQSASTTAATSTKFLVQYQYTGGKKICNDVWVDITNPSTTHGAGSAFQISVNTSTAGLQSAAGLIGSTTVPTSGNMLLNSRDNTGGDARDWWELNSGMYLTVWLNPFTEYSSSTDFTELSTVLNVECRDR